MNAPSSPHASRASPGVAPSSATGSSLSAPAAPRRGQPVARCPFHDGAATLDLLLAELDPRNVAVFDAALDLRSLFTEHRDAAGCVRHLLRVRALLDERHYLAFYRVRCAARRVLRIESRVHGAAPWISEEFPLNCARMDELVNATLARVAADRFSPDGPHVRFTFAGSPDA